MKYSIALSLISSASLFLGAQAASTSEYWTTLTPSASAPEGAITDYTTTFGIAVVPQDSSSSSAGTTTTLARRDVISQVADGQIQASTSTASTVSSESTVAAIISQIGDGQIQATTSTVAAESTVADIISQIGDGQIQATTSTASTSTTGVVSQISDGQVQATSSSETTKTTSVASQISDGQIQASSTTASSSTSSASSASSVSSASSSSSSTTSTSSSATSTSTSTSSPVHLVSCKSDESLSLVLNGSVLTDAKGRIGSIVANRQFQFDGPPPQAGAIYAAGWSITEDGYLALGDQTDFYQCLSGTFYNLYDESIGGQCSKIKLEVVKLVTC
ncbi:hypothetical protein WICMUC_001503 [Wickerhamomyces mucosus]|uniref:Cell wall mannoprotein PIR1-like C-terminal domain-containing protein n=1 Tax=Wickerhamomyces mucosus TaxID=1378264 RepID=A0A9P8THE9_9ASCO|nr:hypothetical protein WICMUC_001503 [Wickerhamomyces mucosus]